MRERAEDQFGLFERRIVGGDVHDVASAEACNRPPLLVRCSKREREMRMRIDECTELAAGITAGPENADWNLIHE